MTSDSDQADRLPATAPAPTHTIAHAADPATEAAVKRAGDSGGARHGRDDRTHHRDEATHEHCPGPVPVYEVECTVPACPPEFAKGHRVGESRAYETTEPIVELVSDTGADDHGQPEHGCLHRRDRRGQCCDHDFAGKEHPDTGQALGEGQQPSEDDGGPGDHAAARLWPGATAAAGRRDGRLCRPGPGTTASAIARSRTATAPSGTLVMTSIWSPGIGGTGVSCGQDKHIRAEDSNPWG